MPWVQYEVWSVDEDGHEELIDTTNSLKEARQLAQESLQEDVVECIIKDDEDNEIEVLVKE